MESAVTTLLLRINRGDARAADELLPFVYEHLRSIAGSLLRDRARSHTLQPTALVHEAYVKLVSGESDAEGWNTRTHFCSVAAIAMRHILHDHARAARAAKRNAGGVRQPPKQIASENGAAPLAAVVPAQAPAPRASADGQAAPVLEEPALCGARP